jgi:hypothetical protein
MYVVPMDVDGVRRHRICSTVHTASTSRDKTYGIGFLRKEMKSMAEILAWTQTRHIVPKLKTWNASLVPYLNINVFDL